MRIVVSGASGLIGRALVARLRAGGHEVRRLVRRPVDMPPTGPDEVHWMPTQGEVDATSLEGTDAVVNLAGENIADQRWNEAKKQRIYDSRVKSTALLSETLARLERRPGVLVSSSAIGFYGSRGNDVLTEESSPGQGFLAYVASAWEAATRPAELAGIRVVVVRTGVVLSEAGGAMERMLPAFRLGLGGRIGKGEQWMSWIAMADLLRIFERVITDAALAGPVNAVAPEPVRNAHFTAVLGRALGRPTLLPVPAGVMRMMLGKEMAEELVLASTRVKPEKLRAAGFEFEYPTVEAAIAALRV